MSDADNQIKDIQRIGDALTVLYTRCWNTALDCYCRNFNSKEESDRSVTVEMTNYLFSACCETLNMNDPDLFEEG